MKCWDLPAWVRSLFSAQWRAAPAHGVGKDMRAWLTDRQSLTQKLIAHCVNPAHFRVKKLTQGAAPCLPGEAQVLGLARRQKVQAREVLLLCDDVPMVYAHTVVPLDATAADWPFFAALGERSLGTTLFGDPRVRRGELEYARLPAQHELARRAQRHLGGAPLQARRCLFQRRHGLLLVTEVFSPRVLELGGVRMDGDRKYKQ